MVLGTDVNDDVYEGKVLKALLVIGISEVVISNHGGESVPATCTRNITETN